MSGAGEVSTLLDTGALITNRDGIAGQWQPPKEVPTPLDVDDPENLKLWDPAMRAQTFDFELISRLGFKPKKDTGEVSVSYLDTAANPMAYLPLVSLTRPSKKIFKQQLEFIEGYAALRPERASELHAQLAVPDAFYASIIYLHPERTPRTLELLHTALRLALCVEQRVKHGLACRRPNEYSPQVQPMIPMPRHGTLPSGHATEAFIFAYVLGRLLRAAARDRKSRNKVYADQKWTEQLMRQAARIAINRQVAGVHFPVDSAAGTVLGLALGHYLVSRCDGATPWLAWSFDGPNFKGENDGPKDYFWDEIVDPHALSWKKDCPYAVAQGRAEAKAEPSPCLKWLWTEAKKEWI